MSEYNQKYTEKEFIGRGNYGKVYLVVEHQTVDFFVAKKISLEGMQFLEIDRTMREIEIHRHLQHSNIIAFKEYFLEEDILIIIMQYCEYGDLSVYIRNMQQKEQLFHEPLIMNLFIQLTLGISYLHEQKIIHRDIKPQNIFINEEGVLKLADFGISKAMEQTQDKAMTLVGTPYYLSPQACKNEGYTSKSDIWSLGCVLYELCTLKHAFQGNNVLSLANKITNDAVEKIPSQYSAQIFQLIEWMLLKDPEQRPTAKQILQRGFVKKYSSQFGQPPPEPQKPLQQRNLEEYQNQFMPNIERQYSNEFLEDESFHPKRTQVTNFNATSSSLSKTNMTNRSVEEQISPRKSASLKLRQKCKKKLGQKLFEDMYSLMRKLKTQGLSEIEIESQVKDKYRKKGEFDQAMDVAQLIYIEDNP